MRPLLFSPAARADLGEIWDFTAERWGPEQAEDYVSLIYSACEALASGLRASRIATVRPGYRKSRAGSHVIYFIYKENALVVVRILHGRMDADRHL